MIIYLDNFVTEGQALINRPTLMELDGEVATRFDDEYEYLDFAGITFRRSINYHPSSPYGWSMI